MGVKFFLKRSEFKSRLPASLDVPWEREARSPFFCAALRLPALEALVTDRQSKTRNDSRGYLIGREWSVMAAVIVGPLVGCNVPNLMDRAKFSREISPWAS